MTLDHSAVTELMEAFRSAEGIDLVRESVRLVLQELIEAEAASVIGARKYERTDGRVTERNGYRGRLMATQAGDIELRIPKLRQGSFFPEILQPRRRIDQALYAVVMEAYVAGVSTRNVDDLVEALGISSGISKSEVSRICAGLDESVDASRNRRLDNIEFPYVFVDATYVHCRDNHQVVSKAVVIATGVAADGSREVLGWAVRSVTPNPKRSGPSSAVISAPAVSAVSVWSSPMSTPDSSPPSAGCSKEHHINGAKSISPATWARRSPKTDETSSRRRSGPSSFKPAQTTSTANGMWSVTASPPRTPKLPP